MGFMKYKWVKKKCPLCLDRMYVQVNKEGREFYQCSNLECQYWEWKEKNKQVKLF